MATVTIRAGFADAPLPPRGPLARLAQRLALRVTLPHRELPPEWFRFPLP